MAVDDVRGIEAALRDEGWSEHTSVARELRTWFRLSEIVNAYELTVDDYTNDLCSRDYLAAAAALTAGGLGSPINQQIAASDQSFLKATVDDTDGRLQRYYRIDSKDGWWWRRLPSTGPLADYLAASS